MFTSPQGKADDLWMQCKCKSDWKYLLISGHAATVQELATVCLLDCKLRGTGAEMRILGLAAGCATLALSVRLLMKAVES